MEAVGRVFCDGRWNQKTNGLMQKFPLHLARRYAKTANIIWACYGMLGLCSRFVDEEGYDIFIYLYIII
jgi:hypothetical protein